MHQECCVCLLVKDYDQAIDFYCRKLQLFRVDADNDFGGGNRFVHLTFLDLQFSFAIHLIKPVGNDCDVIGQQAGNHLFLSFPIQDADLMLGQLSSNGVPTEGGVHELPYGRQIIIKDCIGNRIALFQRFDYLSD